jgi:hypothetical protein
MRTLTDTDTDADTDADTDTDTDVDTETSTTCVPTMSDVNACDPEFECCGFPPAVGTVGVGMGENECTGDWANGGTSYHIDCVNLGLEGAICTCTSW